MLRTRLNYAKMARSWLDKAILSDASLAHADLTGAWLGEAVLDSTNVNETVMHDTWLANARMISTRTLSETQLLKAKVFNSTELLDGYLIDDLGGHTRLVAHINACESGSRRALAPRPID
jgi:uncharacterized protein YjbI with pentapeptide repeats